MDQKSITLPKWNQVREWYPNKGDGMSMRKRKNWKQILVMNWCNSSLIIQELRLSVASQHRVILCIRNNPLNLMYFNMLHFTISSLFLNINVSNRNKIFQAFDRLRKDLCWGPYVCNTGAPPRSVGNTYCHSLIPKIFQWGKFFHKNWILNLLHPRKNWKRRSDM